MTLDTASMRMSLVDTDADDGIEASFTNRFLDRNVTSCIGPGTTFTCPDAQSSVWSGGQDVYANLWGEGPGWKAGGLASPDALIVDFVGPRSTGPMGMNATEFWDLQFTGTGRFTVTADFSAMAEGLDGLSWRETLAFAGLVVWPYVGAHFQADAVTTAPASGASLRSGTLFLSFDVTDGQGYTLLPHVHVHHLGAALASPVPEPATLALVLAGLGIVGASVRRRQG